MLIWKHLINQFEIAILHLKIRHQTVLKMFYFHRFMLIILLFTFAVVVRNISFQKTCVLNKLIIKAKISNDDRLLMTLSQFSFISFFLNHWRSFIVFAFCRFFFEKVFKWVIVAFACIAIFFFMISFFITSDDEKKKELKKKSTRFEA